MEGRRSERTATDVILNQLRARLHIEMCIPYASHQRAGRVERYRDSKAELQQKPMSPEINQANA